MSTLRERVEGLVAEWRERANPMRHLGDTNAEIRYGMMRGCANELAAALAAEGQDVGLREAAQAAVTKSDKAMRCWGCATMQVEPVGGPAYGPFPHDKDCFIEGLRAALAATPSLHKETATGDRCLCDGRAEDAYCPVHGAHVTFEKPIVGSDGVTQVGWKTGDAAALHKEGADELGSAGMTVPKADVKDGLPAFESCRQQSVAGPLMLRFHEDAVEIACCLFNKGLLSGKTIDDAADEIEAWLRALPAGGPAEKEPQP